MATADGRILIRTEFDKTGINTGMSSITKSLTKIGTLVKASLGIGFVLAGKQAVQLASDLQEVQNVVDVAFGDMAYKIEQFADNSIENFGLSELSAKQMASTFMAMANGMSQPLDVASDKAVELTGRLADISSFYNKTISEVETIGRAVYSGETEPLKQIGAIMTEAQLQAFALSQGYSELYKNMSAADKLFIRQSYFLSVTNQAAGDFVRTQDSWANQTKVLSENWKEFLSTIGSGLINVLTPLVKLLNTAVTGATMLAKAIAQVFGLQSNVEQSTVTTSEAVSSTVDSQEDLEDGVKGTNKALKRQLAYFDDINILGEKTSGAGSSSSTTGGFSDNGLVDGGKKVNKELEGLVSNLTKVKEFFDKTFELKAETKASFERTKNKLSETLAETQEWLDQNFAFDIDLKTTQETINKWYNELLTNASNLVYTGLSIWEIVMDVTNLDFGEFAEDFGNILIVAFDKSTWLGRMAGWLAERMWGKDFTDELRNKLMSDEYMTLFRAAGNIWGDRLAIGFENGVNTVIGAIETVTNKMITGLEFWINSFYDQWNAYLKIYNFIFGTNYSASKGVTLQRLSLTRLDIPTATNGSMIPINNKFANEQFGGRFEQTSLTPTQNPIGTPIKLVIDGKEIAKTTLSYFMEEAARQGLKVTPMGVN